MQDTTTAGRAVSGFICALLLWLCLPWPSARAANPIGELKTAVILVNFSDNPTATMTRTAAHEIVFGQVSDFFWENSYQKTFLSGDSFGWHTLPTTTHCDTTRIAEEANAAAAAAGADIAAYRQFVYLFPYNPGCGWSGTLRFGPDGEGRTFINSTFTVQNIAHEMGHVFGLLHSDALECGATTLGNDCAIAGYGDQADTMGNRAAHFNAYQKEKLGWLNAAGVPPITTVTASGRYAISTYEAMGTTPKALKILKSFDAATGSSTWYYVEYRQPIGVDASLSGVGNLARGVLVRTGTNATHLSSTSQLLDMTPGSGSTAAADVKDGALDVGLSHVDSAAGITLTLVSADATGAVLDVAVAGGTPAPACTRNAPSISLTAASTAANAGATLRYTLTLVNRDSDACAATRFDLAASLPSGWSGGLAATWLSASPGATATTSLSVTSPMDAAVGTYPVGVAARSAISMHSATSASTYAVTTDPVATLASSVGTDKNTYARGETVAMSALVKRNGAPVAGASVTFTVSTPSGGSAMVQAVTGSDGYARGVYKTARSKAATGSYVLRADAASDGGTSTSSSGFAVR